MSKTILIIGGTGLIGKTIHEMLSSRNPALKILIGTIVLFMRIINSLIETAVCNNINEITTLISNKNVSFYKLFRGVNL